MITESNIRKLGTYPRVKKNPLKLTALLYLKEALLSEKYEDCPEIVTMAREFGAQNFEIINLLEAPNRIPRG